MLKRLLIAATLVAAATLAACTASAQRAGEAAYGGYVITAETADQIMKSPEVSDGIKVKIQAADSIVFPVAKSLSAALMQCKTATPADKKVRCGENIESVLSLSRTAFIEYARAVLPDSPTGGVK